jgi:hypothetical protein
MLSNIVMNYLGYGVAPLIKNGNSFALQNKHLRVEPLSPVSTDVRYNSNNPSNGSPIIIMNSTGNCDSTIFQEKFKTESIKVKEIGPELYKKRFGNDKL